MYFHVIHYTFTWYFIVPLPFPPPPLLRFLTMTFSQSARQILWVLVACWSFVWTWKKLKLKCAIKFMFHGMNISLISSIFLSFVFTIIQSISEVAEEEKKMYVNFSFELILVSSYILQFSRVTLFVLYIQVHFFCGLFHAFFSCIQN